MPQRLEESNPILSEVFQDLVCMQQCYKTKPRYLIISREARAVCLCSFKYLACVQQIPIYKAEVFPE